MPGPAVALRKRRSLSGFGGVFGIAVLRTAKADTRLRMILLMVKRPADTRSGVLAYERLRQVVQERGLEAAIDGAALSGA